MMIKKTGLAPQEIDEAVANAHGRWLTTDEARHINKVVPRYYSHTQLSLFQKCPMAYKYRYVDGRKQAPPSASLHVGKKAHDTLAYNNLFKIKTGRDLKARDFIGRLEDVWKDGIKDIDWKSEKETAGAAKDSTIRMLQVYHERRAPAIKPLAAERAFLVYVPFICETPLFGYIDLEEAACVADYKTSGSSPYSTITPADHVKHNVQLSIYAMAKYVIERKLVKKAKLEYLVRTRTPDVVPLIGTKTVEDLQRVAYLISSIDRCIKSGDFYPNTEAKMHTPNACGFWDHCHSSARMPLVGM